MTSLPAREAFFDKLREGKEKFLDIIFKAF
jgi:hypothetical protein